MHLIVVFLANLRNMAYHIPFIFVVLVFYVSQKNNANELTKP